MTHQICWISNRKHDIKRTMLLVCPRNFVWHRLNSLDLRTQPLRVRKEFNGFLLSALQWLHIPLNCSFAFTWTCMHWHGNDMTNNTFSRSQWNVTCKSQQSDSHKWLSRQEIPLNKQTGILLTIGSSSIVNSQWRGETTTRHDSEQAKALHSNSRIRKFHSPQLFEIEVNNSICALKEKEKETQTRFKEE